MKNSYSGLLLFFAIVLSSNVSGQCTPGFFDGFESGSYSPTWSIGTGLTSAAVTTTNPYTGTYRLETTGGNVSHLTGLSTIIPSVLPANISWDIFPTGAGSTNYFVAGDNSVTGTNCVFFSLWQGSTSSILFASSFNYAYVASPGQWYHIELQNIDWTSKTFDIYINSVLMQTAFPFRSSTQTSITTLHLYNYNSGTGIYDNILIGGSPAITSISNSLDVSCYGMNDGSAIVSPSGGTGPFTYAWSPSGGNSTLATPLAPGNYTCLITDSIGCTLTETFSITEPTPLVTTSSHIDVSCNGGNDGSAVSVASGGTGPYYFWWSPSGGTAATETGLTAGTFTCLIVDSHSCADSQIVVINEPSALTVVTSHTDILCNGGNNGDASVAVSGGTPGYTYNWLPSGGNSTSVSLITAGNYSCDITDANGCNFSQTFVISEPTPVIASVSSSPVLCNGDTSTISVIGSGGISPYNGDGMFSESAGSYTYIITDANNCPDTATIIVSEPTALFVTVVTSNPTTCGGSDGAINVTIAGGTPGYISSWNTTDTTEDISGLASGVYTVLINDTNGCSVTITNTISDPNPPQVMLDIAVDTICSFDELFALTGGSPAGGIFSGNGVSAGNFDASVAAAGFNVITYSYTDSLSGCSAFSTDSIFVDACTAIKDPSLENIFSMYPNPNNGSFVLYLNTTSSANVTIYDALGKIISFQVIQPKTKEEIHLLESGMYLISIITSDGKQSVQRVIVNQ
ncbi:hypothetical protein BH09BAC5_BH09BAC5_18990 [soil metagenome]